MFDFAKKSVFARVANLFQLLKVFYSCSDAVTGKNYFITVAGEPWSHAAFSTSVRRRLRQF